MRTTIENIEIEYMTLGQGPDFLILHGWGRGIIDWQKIAKVLSQDFRVWIMDLPGFGQSQNPPASWGLSDYVRFVENFLKLRRINEVIILGHSFGGRIAIELASQNPSYLKKLILADSAGIRFDIKFMVKLLRIIVKLGKTLMRLAPKKWEEKVEYWFFKELSKRGVEYANQKPILRGVFKRVVDKNLEPFLEKITVPTLLIWGENDQIIPVEHAKIMNSKIKNSVLKIIPGAGHFPYFEKETEFLMAIRDFLR